MLSTFRSTRDLHAAIRAEVRSGQRLDLSAIPARSLTAEVVIEHLAAFYASALEDARAEIAAMPIHSRVRLDATTLARGTLFALVDVDQQAALAKVLFSKK